MIRVQNIKNVEHLSLCQVIQDDKEPIYLNEKDLISLCKQLYENRPDAFPELTNKIDELEKECNESERRVWELEDRLSSYED